MCEKAAINLAIEIMDSLAFRNKFKDFSRREFIEAASLFADSGFDAWKQIRLLGDETRKFLMGDLRDDGCSA